MTNVVCILDHYFYVMYTAKGLIDQKCHQSKIVYLVYTCCYFFLGNVVMFTHKVNFYNEGKLLLQQPKGTPKGK